MADWGLHKTHAAACHLGRSTTSLCWSARRHTWVARTLVGRGVITKSRATWCVRPHRGRAPHSADAPLDARVCQPMLASHQRSPGGSLPPRRARSARALAYVAGDAVHTGVGLVYTCCRPEHRHLGRGAGADELACPAALRTCNGPSRTHPEWRVRAARPPCCNECALAPAVCMPTAFPGHAAAPQR